MSAWYPGLLPPARNFLKKQGKVTSHAVGSEGLSALPVQVASGSFMPPADRCSCADVEGEHVIWLRGRPARSSRMTATALPARWLGGWDKYLGRGNVRDAGNPSIEVSGLFRQSSRMIISVPGRWGLRLSRLPQKPTVAWCT